MSRRLLAPPPSRGLPRPGCRPGVSRLGTIPICAPRWLDASPILAAPTRADIEAARSVLAGRERFAAGAQIVLLGGQFIAALSDPLPTGVFIADGSAGRAQCGRRSFGGPQRGAKPCRMHHQGRAWGKVSTSRSRSSILASSRRPTRSIRARPLCSTPGRRRRSSRYSKALMQVSSDTQRRS